MPLARFKDLCADATDVDVLSRFWAAALDRAVAHPGGGVVRLDQAPGRPGEEALWLNPVPEPRTAKTRVHLDLRLAAAEHAALLDAGATVLAEPGETTPWHVLADPEGNEFCVFPLADPAPPGQAQDPAPGPVQDPAYDPAPGSAQDPPSSAAQDPAPAAGAAPGAFELVVDCRDAWAQACWWAEVTGGRACRDDEAPWAWVEDAAGFPWRDWVFTPVPEPKTTKNRWHWDVTLASADLSALVSAGARVLRQPTPQTDWWVLADPEGNEFCAFAPDQAAPPA